MNMTLNEPAAEPRFVVYDGTALDNPIYRVVGGCPPTEEDFLSYGFAGRTYPAKNLFRATGVSMFLTRKAATTARRRWHLGQAVAELDVQGDDLLMWARTGGKDHITVWAPPGVLLGYVGSCE